MMGFQIGQKELFSYSVDLDKRIHSGHPLRKIREILDFGFAREQTARFYGRNGNESIDPAVVMKLMFLLFYDNVNSERELMRMLPYRLDYLWFLDFGLDESIPDHSVLSKARRRWGIDVFDDLFAQTVALCIKAGLVDGRKLHMDGCLIDADASDDAKTASSPELIAQLRESLSDEMNKFDESLEASHQTPTNSRVMSTTDPDSEWAGKRGKEKHFRYKTHRAVDNQCGVITAVETTPGSMAENRRLIPLVDQHEARTDMRVDTVVADSQYGTIENYGTCHDRGIRSHMSYSDKTRNLPGRSGSLFPAKDFIYNEQDNTMSCPAGRTLRPRQQKNGAQHYRCRKSECNSCPLKPKCTTSEQGRTVSRYNNQNAIDKAKAQADSRSAKKDRVRRKWLMEGSFADAANNHAIGRSRWRRLWRQRIQDLMIAAIQNLRKLLKHKKWAPAKADCALIAPYSSGSSAFSRPTIPNWRFAGTYSQVIFFNTINYFN
jgi:transposase